MNSYAKIITGLKNGLNENSWKVARTILSWLAGARRPLKWHELQAALSLQLGAHGLVVDHRYRLCDDIQEFNLCGPLLRVVHGEDNMRLEFTHSTAKS